MKHQFKPVLFVVIGGLLVAGAAHGQDSKPDADGFIRNWLMLAPIPLGEENAGADLIGREQIDNEASVKPKEGDKVKIKDKQLAWKSVRCKDYLFDLNEILGSPHENVAGYMVAYVVCDKELAGLALLIGSNDQARIYLNGKAVFTYTEPRAIEKDSDKVDKLTLNKGVNTIVFKVINEVNNWQGCLRFTDKNGKPVTDFSVKLSP